MQHKPKLIYHDPSIFKKMKILMGKFPNGIYGVAYKLYLRDKTKYGARLSLAEFLKNVDYKRKYVDRVRRALNTKGIANRNTDYLIKCIQSTARAILNKNDMLEYKIDNFFIEEDNEIVEYIGGDVINEIGSEIQEREEHRPKKGFFTKSTRQKAG